jgi:hypothetical protein
MSTTIPVTMIDNSNTINFEVTNHPSALLINYMVHSDYWTTVLYT